MDLNLDNKKVLVTGASRGIGLSIAESFLQERAQVCMASRGSNALLDNTRRLQESYGSSSVISCNCDCTKTESLDHLKQEIERQWNNLDVVIVNVGDGRSAPDALPNNDQWQKTWEINFESALKTARAFLPMLRKSKGCLLFVSSIAGMEAFGAPTDYSVAKSAIIALSKNMARKLAPDHVRVNIVAPGNVYFKDSAWDEKIKKDAPKVKNIIKTTVPMNRFSTPAEIADPVVFLCSDRASFITGATLNIDGGQTVGIF